VDATELFAVRWVEPEDGGPAVRLLDQTALPECVEILDCRDVGTLAEAIRALRVRGAPALGVAGAYGVVLGALVDGDAAGCSTPAATTRRRCSTPPAASTRRTPPPARPWDATGRTCCPAARVC
jgi:methylthioribose-1-phosphate isomerase